MGAVSSPMGGRRCKSHWRRRRRVVVGLAPDLGDQRGGLVEAEQLGAVELDLGRFVGHGAIPRYWVDEAAILPRLGRARIGASRYWSVSDRTWPAPRAQAADAVSYKFV